MSNAFIPTNQWHYRILLARIAAVALLVAMIPVWPYFFFQLLKFLVCGTAIFSASVYGRLHEKSWMWGMIGIAIIFNPIAPIFFNHTVWIALDLITALVLFLSLREK